MGGVDFKYAASQKKQIASLPSITAESCLGLFWLVSLVRLETRDPIQLWVPAFITAAG